jgi:hypothetical protein
MERNEKNVNYLLHEDLILVVHSFHIVKISFFMEKKWQFLHQMTTPDFCD